MVFAILGITRGAVLAGTLENGVPGLFYGRVLFFQRV